MKKLTGESMNITEENLKAMQQLFPEAFEEGKIDFDVLRQLLGDFVDDEQERYSFKWNGKGKALRLSQTPSMGTLRPCKEESKDWDNTENLYIEGDNLEILKLLQKSYYGKVKMIYIDPPYNTGNDFVYKDDFRDNIENYKEITRQVDEDGNWYSANGENRETNGRFHTDWLNMMYPRLMLSRNLLSDDGVIFISIDDNEQENLRHICNEVFGENNFVTTIVWQKIHSIKNDAKYFSENHEYSLVYSKSIDNFNVNLLPRSEEMNSRYKNLDNDPRGPWQSGDLVASGERSNGHYIIKSPKTGKEFDVPLGKHWVYSEENLNKLIDDNQIWFGPDGNSFPIKKRFLSGVKDGRTPSTLCLSDEVGHNQTATREVKSMFDDKVFDFPKPVSYIIQMLMVGTVKDSLIIDFFAGSSTTAHSIMQINAEDGGNRKFIMVQLPEPTDENSEAYKAGYKNICEIGKERIRRAGEKIKAEAGDKAADLDIGFKVFKLDSSNLQKWNPQPDDLVMTLQQAADNFLPDRTEQDVLYEIMLKMGLELTCQIEEEQAAGETVYIIGGGALMICLGRNITTAVAEAVVKLHEEYESELWQVVFRDTGFASDMDKTNVKETLKAAGLDEDSFVCV